MRVVNGESVVEKVDSLISIHGENVRAILLNNWEFKMFFKELDIHESEVYFYRGVRIAKKTIEDYLEEIVARV